MLGTQASWCKDKWNLQNSSNHSENNASLLWSNHWRWWMDSVSTENWQKCRFLSWLRALQTRLGNLKNEFWLRNENIFTLTLQGLYPRGNKLRIDMMNAKKIKKSVRYSYFHINNAVNKDTLHVNGYMSIETT